MFLCELLSCKAIKESATTYYLSVKVKPGKRDNRLFFENEGFVLHVNAPAVEGKANEACMKFLAKFFGLSASSVEFVQGNTSSFKRFKFYGLSDTDANLRLEPLKVPQPYLNKTND